MKHRLFAFLLTAGVVSASAAGAPARIDVNSTIRLEPGAENPDCKVEFMNWKPEAIRRQNLVISTREPVSSEYRKIRFTFVPKEDGKVVLSLRGPYLKSTAGPIKVMIDYDEVSAEGAEIPNGGFETAGKNGVPAGWRFGGDKETPARVISEAASGKNAVRVWFNGLANCTLTVRKDVPVTLSMMVREGASGAAPSVAGQNPAAGEAGARKQ